MPSCHARTRLFPLLALAACLTVIPALGGEFESNSHDAISALTTHLGEEHSARKPIVSQAFSTVPLTRGDAEQAAQLLWKDHVSHLRRTRQAEMKAKLLRVDKHEMRFDFRVFGRKPPAGRSLFISMHGGGGAPRSVNDQQWRKQLVLYQPAEGVYVAPRAPTDTWNLWHQAHIDPLFDRLIENMVVFYDVNPNRVYLMGYSAGGDGVYQLAPRMADRWAAASMMAGHPNETSPRGLRNVPFTIHVGERDAGYKRNEVAKRWETQLADLREEDPRGYVHHVQLHAGKGHWMDRQDAVAVPWMTKYARDSYPARIVWRQDDVTHGRCYWLAVDDQHRKARTEIIATRARQSFVVQSNDVKNVVVRLKDRMSDLDQPVKIHSGDVTLFDGKVPRTIGVLAQTLAERGDRVLMFSAQVAVTLP